MLYIDLVFCMPIDVIYLHDVTYVPLTSNL